MADMSREEAIDTLKRLKTTHMGDFGWDLAGTEAFDFAISDMERVEQLEAENKRLKDGIAKAKAKVERKCIGKQFSEAVIYGMRKAVGIFDEYLGEVEHENEK